MCEQQPRCPECPAPSMHGTRKQTGGHVGRTSFSQVEKACSHIPQKSFAPTKRTRTQSSRYCPPLPNNPVCRWLFPDDDARERLHPEFFGPLFK